MSADLFIRLKELLPDAPLLTGAVTAVFTADGTASIEMPGGGVLRVRNPIAATVGQRVFVQGDAVTGLAPGLTLVLIEI